MTHAMMLKDIKTDLDRVDADSLLSIREIIDKSLRKVSALVDDPETARVDRALVSSHRLKFIGENLTLEQYKRLSLEEREELQWRLKVENQIWLQEKFSALDAAWLIVVDGEVFAAGKSLKDRPMQPQVLAVCKSTEKFPFVFINDKFVAIEENASPWHLTNQVAMTITRRFQLR